ncbi:MAG: CehA/McbA family metallohydrolase [Roseiflexaceae bacterium]
MHVSPGALHIHTHYSDGSGTIPDVCAAAQAAGLEWIIITDHDTLEGRFENGWHDQVLVVIDQEITPFHNHFLALNLEQVISSNQSPQAFIDQVYNSGGFGIIAHPDEQKYNSFKGVYRWDDWNVHMPTNSTGRSIGIELWNFMSDWGESLTNYNTLLNYIAPKQALRGPTKATIEWWDALNMAGKRAFGVFGVDVHAFLRSTPFGRVQVFPYQWMFGTLTNYLWLPERLPGNFAAALHMVYGALAQGRSYMVNRMEGDCPNVEFRAFRGSEHWYAGDIASLQTGPITIKVDLGVNAPVRLICNGQVLQEAQRQLLVTVNTIGVYRIESYKSKLPWMMSNPLYITQ